MCSFDVFFITEPCEINEAVEMYNLQPPGEKLYVKHNSKHRLNCTSGWIAGDVIKQTYVDVQCSDGNLQIDNSCKYNFCLIL